ncbi:hypothetical protein [uncultured Maribacter sp.]|uniref:hypothetical protein n=1 Tax=uncultured Maribacter sp. TaxID=431308 RepID=UPI0026300641|nr:hypothetical protein [uncultured Maribacter sp.]
MRYKVIILFILSVFTGFSQSEIRKKKLSIGLNIMGQNVTDNSIERESVFYNHKPINYDVQFKIGRIFYKEKITAGLALNFGSVNYYDNASARQDIEENRADYYKSTIELQFGFFARYKVYDEFFVDAYVGLLGVFPDGGFFPRVDDSHNITKYNFSIGYSIHLWHFIALEPHISIRNSRLIYMGRVDNYDKISPLSLGLGLAFKL